MAEANVKPFGTDLTLTREALDFAPDLLAIQERPPERLPRVIVITITVLVLLLVLWATLAQRDLVAQAQGRLVPLTFTKVVQPSEAGIVSEILVKDGDRVREGQVLLRLDARLSDADHQAQSNEVELRRLSLAHIEAELSGVPVRVDGAYSSHLVSQVRAQFEARHRAYEDAVSQEEASLRRAKSELVAAEQVQAKLAQTLPAYRQAAEAYKKLLAEGFVGELASMDKQRELLEREQDSRAQAATVDSLKAAIAQVERRLAVLRSQYRSQLQNDRAETGTQLNRGAQELQKTSVKAGLLELRAPTAGVVKDLGVTGAGAVVAAGALLMNIVPVDERLQAEVLLQNEDAGFVAVGQEVRVKVAAYPFQKYGMLNGKVAMISADSADPKQTPAGQVPNLTYRAIVRLESASLGVDESGQRLNLNAGMLVAAEIHQGRQSVVEWLLSPVRRVAQEAARER